jgi:eukaryotic-like serine/threonine-protein kinase
MISDSAPVPYRYARIGKYQIQAHLATGGMGAVYRAVDPERGLTVALKVLPPDLAARPAVLERFRREARHGLKLRHENIVTLYEFGEAEGTFYLAMEFVDGIDLQEHIKRNGPLDPVEACAILLQVARALDHAYQAGIIHRDIKPSNVLLCEKDGHQVAKLTDLGLAVPARDEEFRLTRDGTTVGTIDYISPEQARDSRAVDVRSDLYSLGCTWFHMLTGRPPFAEGSLPERLIKHAEAAPPDVQQFNPRVTAGLVAILQRLLAKKPDDRYQTPAELIKDGGADAVNHRPAAGHGGGAGRCGSFARHGPPAARGRFSAGFPTGSCPHAKRYPLGRSPQRRGDPGRLGFAG